MRFREQRALELLRAGTGVADATFRPGQCEAIQHIVEGRGRLLLVQKTGWGKSNVYFIAAKLLREGGLGPALLFSPLLALMRNQIDAAVRMGVRALTIHSDNQEEWGQIEQAVEADQVDVLLISPERLANARFMADVLAGIAARVSLIVIDEAHCISDWGHDFRPHYRLIERMSRNLPATTHLVATTATANNRVMADLRDVLGPQLTVARGDLRRPSLSLQTIRMPDQADRLAWLARQLTQLPGSGIIYVLTKRDAQTVAAWLQSRGHNVAAYTSETGSDRIGLEQALLRNRVKALVATSALAMGFDKPDLAFVIHFQTPGSVVAYYQQVGRAGRALERARGVLLSGAEEADINDFFITTAFPTRDEAAAVLGALEAEPSGLSVSQILSRINVSRARTEKTLQLLSLESPPPIARAGLRWQLTAARLGEGFWDRADRLTALRRQEQQQMQEYVALNGGHMEFLVRALDGDPGPDLPPSLAPLSAEVDRVLTQAARVFLRRTSVDIEPRERWPGGGLPIWGLSGPIALEQRAQPGKALSIWGDSGWGELVRQGKYVDDGYSDELIGACAGLVAQWRPEPPPAWVTYVPSRRRPVLVAGFAQRLAAALGLPCLEALVKTHDTAEQKDMLNSAQQARNLDGTIAVTDVARPSGPVLLVDDICDSRWTLTVCSWLLRSSGSGPVWPMALALAGGGSRT